MNLQLDDPGWLNRRTDDLLPDHGHLMHLYVIRVPEMDLVWHLHPERADDGNFTQQLPAMPAGRYALFGDVVHANGLAETATAEVNLPQIAGRPLTGDDAGGAGPAVANADYSRTTSPLAGGYRMVWDRGEPALHARQPYEFPVPSGRRERPARRRSRNVHGNARARRVRERGSQRLRARASFRLGPDAGAATGTAGQSARRCT